ncbi:MAG: hypothetical protein H6506_02830 [Calditrichaeota bacterium]|nr:hypothetical protein [Calditrichota bacterium]MCB9391569.1 hypothetical protein [Calditrichota bacterium]
MSNAIVRQFRISVFLFFVSASLFVSCKKGEEGKSGVTGRITAAEGTGAGALVRLYPAPDPFAEESVWSVPDGESSVGFDYDLHFGFDHRLLSSARSDTADNNGDFQFEDVTIGDYVIVADKPGQGWTPYRLIHVSGDLSVGDLQLPRVRTYSNDDGDLSVFIQENTTWEAGTQYVIRDNAFVRSGATLTIQPGATVLLAGNKALNIQDGTLVCRGTADKFIVFAAADVVSRDPDEWLRVRLSAEASPPNFAYTAFRNGATAISTEADSGLVEYCSFERFVNEGVLALQQPPLVRRCVFNLTATGIWAASTAGFHCERNVFQTCDPFAIVLDSLRDGEIFCNWFRDCGGADTSGSVDRGVISMDLVTDFDVHNNYFETSWHAFAMGSHVDSSVYIHHNQFHRMNRVVDISVTEERRGPSYPTVKYNCFTTISRSVIFIHCNQHNTHDMDATSNYWGTTSIATIESNYINDRNDDPICPIVYIDPVLASCADVRTQTGTDAGICP